MERDLAFVVVLDPEKLPFGDRYLPAGSLCHRAKVHRNARIVRPEREPERAMGHGSASLGARA
ncbi:Hypothetical protein A7982_03814 [Minicystis rosea]|nr:Hypothetical protein A7982_03814 [Minicystis rosea]